jgi:class 3 adenylate cyclase
VKFCEECGATLDVVCAACGASAPAGKKFCGACGAALGAVASSGAAPAGRFTTPRAYTPAHLAERILNDRGALSGERKQVTVLFADVQGSMTLAEQVDPEKWHGILDRFFQILSDGVHRFEGTVNQYIGDGI